MIKVHNHYHNYNIFSYINIYIKKIIIIKIIEGDVCSVIDVIINPKVVETVK